MIVRPHNDRLLCVGQASHAWISGQLSARWGNADFAPPDPYEGVCLGAEQHDVGMAEYDLRPEHDPETGGPRSFMDMPLLTHLELWTAAPRKLLTQSPFAALVCSMHGHALYADDDTLEPDAEDSEAVKAFVEHCERFEASLKRQMGVDDTTARHTQKLVWAVDFLSLSCFMDWDPDSVPAPTTTTDLTDIKVLREGTTLYVDPWPFDRETLTVEAAGRHIDPQPSQQALHAALDEAPWEILSYSLRPGS
jgi:hypothetical protein